MAMTFLRGVGASRALDAMIHRGLDSRLHGNDGWLRELPMALWGTHWYENKPKRDSCKDFTLASRLREGRLQPSPAGEGLFGEGILLEV